MKRRVMILAGAFLCLALGWFGATVERQAHAQSVEKLAEFADVGEVNGVSVYRISDSGSRCYVTTPSGSIACVR